MTRLLNKTRIAKMRNSIPAQVKGKSLAAAIPYVVPLIMSTGTVLSQVLDPLGLNISTIL